MTHQLLTELLGAAARDHPDHTAVVDRERSVTYRELDRRTNQVARLLTEADVRAGDRVGVLLEKSLESILAVYGVLKAGAAYVPLDVHAPPARLAHIMRDCGLRVLVTGERTAPKWAEYAAHGAAVHQFVVLNAPATSVEGYLPAPAGVAGVESLDRADDAGLPVTRSDADLAYILYTSGSTGIPKGVMLSHRNALAFVEWAAAEFALGPHDRVSSHAPIHFDLSIFDIYATASAGASLVLVPDKVGKFPVEVVRFIERARITVWYSVPSILSMMVQRGNLAGHDLTSLRAVIFAGEVFHTGHLRQLMEEVPQARFTNLYGPTETNVCTYFHVPVLPPDMTEPIPIGQAITGVRVVAITEDGVVADPGQEGELYVEGPTVTSGYWGAPELSARSLVPLPGPGDGGVAYRTGDLARQDADGNYVFLGRRDLQVKTRGHRVELGDIETALYANSAVVECAVVAVPDESISNRIIAFAVVNGDVDERAILGDCNRRVPQYMVPETLRLRSTLPKTSTGKIDRQALTREALAPDPDEPAHLDSGMEASP
ncbi:MAG: amino acid adenylation domain-containing protein [Acidimicrobiales bacterium]